MRDLVTTRFNYLDRIFETYKKYVSMSYAPKLHKKLI